MLCFGNLLSLLQKFFIAEKIVEPNQQHYPWYHQKYRRVPEIDQCDVRDVACQYEAEEQFIRDKYDPILHFKKCKQWKTREQNVCLHFNFYFERSFLFTFFWFVICKQTKL